jgi:hypothetical protein
MHAIAEIDIPDAAGLIHGDLARKLRIEAAEGCYHVLN